MMSLMLQPAAAALLRGCEICPGEAQGRPAQGRWTAFLSIMVVRAEFIRIWTTNLNMSLNFNGAQQTASPHQHIVGRSLQDANSHIAGLRSSGVTVRVHQPGQVTSSRLRILVCKL